MNYLKSIGLLIVFSLPLYCFSQTKGLDKILGAAKILEQDTAKPKAGTTSNLAVTDEGAKGDKSKTGKTVNESPTDKLKRDIAPNAVQPAKTTTGGTTNNLAVTDEGAPGEKSKSKTSKETSTGTIREQPKTETAPVITPK